MADPTPTPPPQPPAPSPPPAQSPAASPPPHADEAKAAQAASSPAGKPEDAAKQATAPAEKDPMRELLDRMDRMRPLIAGTEPGLARTMQSLSEQGTDPDRRSQIGFRHQVAYALQDLEKTPIGRIDLPQGLRQDMNQLAGSAPGLENERMQAVMRATAFIEDRALVREIRNTGAAIGRQVNQNEPDVLSRIDVLENRLRLTERPPEPAASSQETENGAARRSAATDRRTTAPGPDDDGQAGRRGRGPQMDDFGQQGGQRSQQILVGRGILDTLMSGMRGKDQGNGAPWNPPPTPMAERLSAFEKKMTDTRDEQSFETALKSGRAALDAIQGFSNGEGASVMGRIQQAARGEPGGMSAVLAEMRDGGKFSDLRRQFNNALETDLGLAGAYDKASAALRTFDRDRSSVQDIVARRPDATAIAQRFEKLDAEIGEAAAKTPSRNDGSSMFDDLSQKAAELVQKAIAAVKSVFTRSPGADASGPSPSP